MKKMVFLLAVTLTAGSMVWAQYSPPDPGDVNIKFLDKPAVFPGFNAASVSSVEGQLAPGFTTMVEDYIDPAFFDPEIGTFLLLHSGLASNDHSIAFGVGKTLGSFYVGAYYRGNILQNGSFGVTASNPADNDAVYENSVLKWNNNVALLFGVAGHGIRLDYIDGGNQRESNKIIYDDNYIYNEPSTTTGPSLALSWGSHFGNLYPWAKVGFKFPNTESVGGVELNESNMGDDYGKNATKSSGSVLNIEAAALYDFSGGNFTDTVTGIFTFGTMFKDKYTGDTEVIETLSGYEGPIGAGKEYDYGGAWGLNLYLNYRKTLELDKFTVKITPNLNINVMRKSDDYSIVDAKNPQPTWFTLEPGVTLGVKFQPFEKLAFFTGLDFRLLQWNTYSTPGGDDDLKNDATYWEVKGIYWNMNKSSLALGMAWTPIQGLVISTNVSSILGAFAQFDTQRMSVRKGTIFDDTQTSNVGDWAMVTLGKLFSSFDLTVTYTY